MVGLLVVALAAGALVLAAPGAPPAEAMGSSDYRAEVMDLGENLRSYWRLGDAPTAPGGSFANQVVSGPSMGRFDSVPLQALSPAIRAAAPLPLIKENAGPNHIVPWSEYTRR